MKTKFRSFQLAKSLYKQSAQLKLPGHISNQLQRASSSVALNLAEGRGRPTRADQLRFFHIALGSVRECQAFWNCMKNVFRKKCLT